MVKLFGKKQAYFSSAGILQIGIGIILCWLALLSRL